MDTQVFDSVEDLIKNVKPKTIKLGKTSCEKITASYHRKLDKHQAKVVIEQINSQLSEIDAPNPALPGNKLREVLSLSDWSAYVSGNTNKISRAGLELLFHQHLISRTSEYSYIELEESEEYKEVRKYWLRKINIEIPIKNSWRVTKCSICLLWLPKILKAWGIEFSLESIK
jgi:hypothetical protein